MNRYVMSALLALLPGAEAAAQNNVDLGRETYETSCATCHGASADGHGPMAELLNTPVPDLTRISARHDGAFPWLKVVHIVDGRSGLRGHGGTMPIFGLILKGDTMAVDGPDGNPVIASARVFGVVAFLESIQVAGP